MGREISCNNVKYRLHIFLLLFFGEYQTCFKALINKMVYICEILIRTKVPDIISRFSSRKFYWSIIDTPQ